MKMTNEQIYKIANDLLVNFSDSKIVLPIKVNFYLQKNKQNILSLAQEIDTSRSDLISKYGTFDEEKGQYQVPEDKVEEANKELQDLFSLEQDVDIYKVSIDNFPEDISLTTGQMEAIVFMIE